MATKAHSIKLTPHFDRLVREKVSTGRYEAASDVVREGLRLLEDRDKDLEEVRQHIELGWRQAQRGELVSGDDVFAEIQAMSRSRRAKGRNKA